MIENKGKGSGKEANTTKSMGKNESKDDSEKETILSLENKDKKQGEEVLYRRRQIKKNSHTDKGKRVFLVICGRMGGFPEKELGASRMRLKRTSGVMWKPMRI